MGPLRLPGWYDFALADQRGWDLLDIMDVTALYALSRGGWDLLDFLDGPEGAFFFRFPGCYDFVRAD